MCTTLCRLAPCVQNLLRILLRVLNKFNTCNDNIAGLHNQTAVGGFRRLLVANEFMRDQFEALIANEVANASQGLPAALCIKVWGLLCYSWTLFCACNGGNYCIVYCQPQVVQYLRL